ncbi:hypothetical protein VNO77_28352 [Canavalia gladiata]|uniref:RRM domain-containing protein n=1 Tax=Canavalia gladiata TaxID=3824 RepID=A0AAN9QB62_CANGL
MRLSRYRVVLFPPRGLGFNSRINEERRNTISQFLGGSSREGERYREYCAIREMGTKAKKTMKKNLKRAIASKPSESTDFLPLEGGPALKLPEQKLPENTATVLYVGRIPHGFYEKEMEGKSRHFGFLEFESPEVAKIVADTMHNYLLFEHLLQVFVIPPEDVHPKLWRGFNYHYKPLDSVQIERKRHDKERTLAEHKKLVERIMKCDEKRQKRIEAAGIDYECPEMVGNIQPAPKKIKFED